MTPERNRLIVKSLKWTIENNPELTDRDSKKMEQIISEETFESGIDWSSDFNDLGS